MLSVQRGYILNILLKNLNEQPTDVIQNYWHAIYFK
jgi:hypothetical protein